MSDIETRKETHNWGQKELFGEVKSGLYIELYAFFGFGTFAQRATNIINICMQTHPNIFQKVSQNEVKKQPRKLNGKSAPTGKGLERKQTPKGSQWRSKDHSKNYKKLVSNIIEISPPEVKWLEVRVKENASPTVTEYREYRVYRVDTEYRV